MNATNVIDVTAANFQQVLLEQAPEQLILVELWSERSEESRAQSPVLLQLAQEFSQQLILARIDCDQQPQLAMQFGVQSVPTVALLRAGQPLDGFSGRQPVEVIKEMLLKHLPKPEDELLSRGRLLLGQQSVDEAYGVIKEALALAPTRADIQLVMIEVYLALGRLSNARALIDTIGLADQGAGYRSLLARLVLAEEAVDSPEIQQLQQQLQHSPNDLSLKMQLAAQLNQACRQEEAMELLMGVLRSDLSFDGGKAMLVDILATLPSGDPLASKYRRQLYSLLH